MSRYPPYAMLGPAAIARWVLHTQTSSMHVDGVENIPAQGPVLIVARHFHHLLDGAVLVRYVPRPLHIIVGLDWTADAKQRAWMERACRAVQWPIVLRPKTLGERAGYARSELLHYTRTGLQDASAHLCAGHVVVAFPEGYPNVDPAFARKSGDDAFLPFEPGYLRVLQWAARDGAAAVAIVPLGLHYERGARWSIAARFGKPCFKPEAGELESAVRELSRPL